MPSPIAAQTLKLAILSRDYENYHALLAPLLPDDVLLIACTYKPADIPTGEVQLILGDPDLVIQVVNLCDKLEWVQSTWAGNAPLLQADKQDYMLTGVKGIFDAQMREYIFSYLLYFARNIEGFKKQQQSSQQKWQPPEFSSLKGKTLGILGAGDIAAGLVDVAVTFGMSVIGLNRSGESSANYQALFTPENKLAFAKSCDFVVNLLPDTPSTRHFIDMPFLTAMPTHSILINAGRGIVIDDNALIKILTNQQIRAAVLDVFISEPLSDDHPYWLLPNAYVTQHTAAISQEQDVAAIFKGNLRRFLDNKPLIYTFDFERGY